MPLQSPSLRFDMPLPRRRLIGSAGLALGSLSLAGCASTRVATTAGMLGPTNGPAGCDLGRPNIAPDRVIRDVVGLRPYRKSGFVVREEKIGDTRVVHNYGHGGSGITLSWGTSKLAIDLGLVGQSDPRVAVIGAGAVGLTTARLAQEAGFDVTIYAAALPPETTSNVAGGQWYPSILYDDDAITHAFEQQMVAAAHYSYRRYQIMVGDDYGVRWMRNYELSDHPFGMGKKGRLLQAMLPEARLLGPGEHPFPTAYARQFDGMIIETPRFLRQMMRDIHVAGGTITVRKFNNPAELASLPEKLVFNCTGLGAKDVFGDTELTPVRGQLAVLLPQPEVDYAVLAGGPYMFSRPDGLLLGGTTDSGETDLTPDPGTRADILKWNAGIFDHFRCA